MPGEIQNEPPQPIAFGKYTLLERISHGGMAEVFRAKTRGMDDFERVVAIKLLLPQVANDSDFVTMLIDEAKIAGQLSHANIAQIFDLGRFEGRYYIVQEYVPGRDLRAILRHLDDVHGRLSIAGACHVILKVCDGLDYAHNKRDSTGMPLNLVHRDISPQNVIVSHEGEVKLIDFGIVKAEGRATRTLAGLVKGKFAYMSPEQIRGLPVDRRSDVFACGIVLHELLTGKPLFKRGTEFETLQRARSAEIEPPSRHNSNVLPELDRIALKALSRHVDDRYQTASALRDDLWEFVRSSGHFHTRDQLAAWMRETFGEPSSTDLEPVTSPAELGPPSELLEISGPPLAPASLFEDEENTNMTVVDGDLVSRLDDSDDEVDIVVEPAVPELATGSALRELADAAQKEPDRAVFIPGAAAPPGPDRPPRAGGNGAGPIDLTGAMPGEDEDPTRARSNPLRDDAGSSWGEPQTPTRRRLAAPPDLEDAMMLATEERSGMRDTIAGESVPTALFLTMGEPGPDESAAPLGPPPPIGLPPVPIAPPDALTIGPAQNLQVPSLPLPPFRPATEPPPYPPTYEPAFTPADEVIPLGPPPVFRYAPPESPASPSIHPHQHGHALPPGLGPLGGMTPHFLPERRSSGRYLVAAACAVLVASMTISIVLSVTGG